LVVTSTTRAMRDSSAATSTTKTSRSDTSTGVEQASTLSADQKNNVLREWILTGVSTVYLIHFASLYTQLPGLFGRLTPDINVESTWILQRFSAVSSNNNWWGGMEVLCATGLLTAALQLVNGSTWRTQWRGVLSYSLLWFCWHDLVTAGGRFMEYQMDLLLLDVAPLTVLLSMNPAPACQEAALFGYRWLLSRLYLGAGAVKLLSCDSSWRDGSAIRVHWQSQPLPNPVAHQAAVTHATGWPWLTEVLTLAVLVWEMAAPFLFLAPHSGVRRFAFVGNVLLMAGIALFGDFGPLQLLLVIVGLALLKEEEDNGKMVDEAHRNDAEPSSFAPLVKGATTGASLALAAGASLWTFHNVNSMCMYSWSVAPLVYDLAALGLVHACLPSLEGRFGSVALSVFLYAGSVATMANGLGVYLPWNDILELLNIGASPYHLFATMTGKTGRPVAAIEAASTIEGPWYPIPFLYQVNDPARPLPFCFPHFPRLDWTVWFIPLGQTGSWIARLFQGITTGDAAVLSLLDEHEFRKQFPDQPPAIVRVVPRIYKFNEVDTSRSPGDPWLAKDDERYRSNPVLATFSRGKWEDDDALIDQSWPSVPVLRRLVEASGRPEYFVWGCLTAAELARRLRTTTSDGIKTVREDS